MVLFGTGVKQASLDDVYKLGVLYAQTGKVTAENRIHDADIKDMQFSNDGTHFITASGDRTSKLVDAQDLQVMKEFAFERPANAAAMSPIADHVSILVPDATSTCIYCSGFAWLLSLSLRQCLLTPVFCGRSRRLRHVRTKCAILSTC